MTLLFPSSFRKAVAKDRRTTKHRVQLRSSFSLPPSLLSYTYPLLRCTDHLAAVYDSRTPSLLRHDGRYL